MLKSKKVSKGFKGFCIAYVATFIVGVLFSNISLFGYADGNWSDTLYEYTNNSPFVEITDAVLSIEKNEMIHLLMPIMTPQIQT